MADDSAHEKHGGLNLNPTMGATPRIRVEGCARVLGLLGGLNGFLAIAMDALVAHALRARLDAHALELLRLAAHYQLFHALALLALSALLAAQAIPKKFSLVIVAAALMLAGIVGFSGGLYLKALTPIQGLGFIVPLGGFSYILGWLFLALAFAWPPRCSTDATSSTQSLV